MINLYYEHDGKSTTSEELAFSSEWSANATAKKALAQLSPSQACSLPLSISALGVHYQQNTETPEIKLTRNHHKKMEKLLEMKLNLWGFYTVNFCIWRGRQVNKFLFIYLLGDICDNNGIFIHDQDLFSYPHHIHVHKLFTMAVWGMYKSIYFKLFLLQ